MLRKVSSLVNNVNLFKIVTLVIFIFQNVPSDFDIENIPMKIAFVWGMYLLAKDFFFEKNMFKEKFSYLLFALCVSFGITVLLNFPFQFPYTVYNLGYLMQTVLLVYPFQFNKDEDQQVKWLTHFNDIFIVILFVLSLVSLIYFIFDIQYWVIDGTGNHWLRQGFLENRLFGLFTSPNFGAILGLLSVFMSVINNSIKRGDWKQFTPFYIANLIVQYFYYILANSRGTTLTIFALFMGFFIYQIFRSFQNSTQNKSRQIGKVIIVNSLLLFTIVSVNNQVEKVAAYIPPIVSEGLNFFDQGEESKSSTGSSIISPVVIQHSEEDSEVSSGRFTIWKAGVDATLQRPFFGLGDIDIYRNTKNNETINHIDMSKLSQQDRSELKRAQGNMHNTYVAIFTKGGLFALVIVGVFGCFYLFSHLMTIVRGNISFESAMSQQYIIIFVMILALLAENLVENHILFANRNVIGHIFWVYAGYLNYLQAKLKTTKVR
ncbi:O-antigen ligase family protein [Aerococcus kribbianus]|uniref:O-antigen ligase family protein n=1 Tax=Aerococcus kribbianus TaxID=2999064 RepID=A0A9X3JF67_9LACT|nr:O-antigen ligase family protein [Aerococcus sp. YH-aer222]MCZ0725591.1 O-antigen ligase family protein [Aerococcus sp. YH-aer222]